MNYYWTATSIQCILIIMRNYFLLILAVSLIIFQCDPKPDKPSQQNDQQKNAAELSSEEEVDQEQTDKTKTTDSGEQVQPETKTTASGTATIEKTDVYLEHYRLYQTVLQQAVSYAQKQGIQTAVVNYDFIKTSQDFQKVFDWYQNAPVPEKYAEKYAYWVNAYNVYTLKLMSEKSNGRSIMKIDSGKAFDNRYYKVGGTSISLNEIEKGRLKPLGKVEYHFALVCAALSCPDLSKTAYTAENVFWLMKAQAKKFFQNSTKGLRVDDSKKTVYTSTLGKWYGEEFKKHGSFTEYAAQFFEGETADKIKSYEIKYIPYNWSANSM